MLELKHLSARYDTVSGYVNAVDDVNLTIKRNEIFGIAGESGCGKSTLLKVMYDLVQFPLEISRGEVSLEHRNKDGSITVYHSGEIHKSWWRLISYIPQGAMHVMNPVTRVRNQFFDTVSKYHKKRSKKEMEADIVQYLRELELPADVLGAYPHQLSGGMRQRALIALATFLSPEIVLADEPTTALDVVVQRGILTMLKRTQKRLGNSMVIVSHDMGVHYQITDRLGIMYAGKLIEAGPTMDIFERPGHPYARMLIAALPRLGDSSQKEGIPGTPPSLRNPPPGCRFAERCPDALERCRTTEPLNYQVGKDHTASCHLLDGKAPPSEDEGGQAHG
ncbi:MAG: ABC transporter ATP-binding protein [Treponema sp.]|jgi:peptide/nickel transport system ATP-binding protein|nr:ABC transporter ATP-binding protein [Treponema sp.]